MIEPIKAYLRVKHAMGRLEAEISNAKMPEIQPCSSEVSVFAGQTLNQERDDSAFLDKYTSVISAFASQTVKTSQEQRGVEEGDAPVRTPKFKWHTSPAKAYGFKEMSTEYGYDPRDTSVYWIEKRAAALRRKWKKHGQKLRSQVSGLEQDPTVEIEDISAIEPQESEPTVKYFQPADADYNSVWPPVDMPAAPPKAAKKSIDDESIDTRSKPCPQLSLACDTQEIEPNAEFSRVSNIPALAAQARIEAEALGNLLIIPAKYAQLFGMSPSVETAQNTHHETEKETDTQNAKTLKDKNNQTRPRSPPNSPLTDGRSDN